MSAALYRDRPQQEEPDPRLWADVSAPAAAAGGEEVRRVDDIKELEALTNRDGFLGIEYVS